jgi:hypothetical protein
MSTKQVKIKDYEKEQHILKVALNSVGLMIDYETVDLIHRTLTVLESKKGEMSILDSSKIVAQHKEDWEEYFKKLEQEDEKTEL